MNHGVMTLNFRLLHCFTFFTVLPNLQEGAVGRSSLSEKSKISLGGIIL